MITQVEIMTAINGLLRKIYPDIEVYGREVTEGYNKPSFFTQILSTGAQYDTRHWGSGKFTLKITYFQNVKDDLDQLTKVDEIRAALGKTFTVGNRILTVGEYSHDYAGNLEDILQISVDFTYNENLQEFPTEPIATDYKINITKEN